MRLIQHSTKYRRFSLAEVQYSLESTYNTRNSHFPWATGSQTKQSYHSLHIKMKDHDKCATKIGSFAFDHCSLPSRISAEKKPL